MFTIEARVEKEYELSARRRTLHDFFMEAENFSRYMSEIIADVEKRGDGLSVWTLQVDVSGSLLKVRIDMATKHAGEGKISHEPRASSDDRLAIYTDMDEAGERTNLNFVLDLRLERESSFEVHPLAGFIGERSINKIVKRHAEEYVDQFVEKAVAESGGQRTKKR